MNRSPIVRPDPSDDAGREHWFARLGRFSARRRRTVMLVWLVLTLATAPLAVTLTGALSGAGWEAQGSIAQRVRDSCVRTSLPSGPKRPWS